MRTLATLLAAVFLVSTTGCATMLKGTTDQITVISDPSGANVSVNAANQGTTPTTFVVPSKEDLNVEVSKAGYETQVVQNQSSFRWGWEVWAFIAYVIPFVVDLASGAAWGHQDLTMSVHLQPVSSGSPVAAGTPAPVATAAAQAAPSSAAATPSPSSASTPSVAPSPSSTPTPSWAPPPSPQAQ